MPVGRFGWREALGILACTWAGWAACAAAAADDESLLLWFWYLPLPYFLAWFVAMLPRPSFAVLALCVLGAGNALLLVFGLVLGSATLGLAALPAMVVCATLFGGLAARVQAALDPGIEAAAWRGVHIRGCTAAGIALVGTFITRLYAQGSASTWVLVAVLVGMMTAGFGWHLLETARLARRHGLYDPAAARRLVLLAPAILLAAALFFLLPGL